jgi:hypothetical protein
LTGGKELARGELVELVELEERPRPLLLSETGGVTAAGAGLAPDELRALVKLEARRLLVAVREAEMLELLALGRSAAVSTIAAWTAADTFLAKVELITS